MMHKNLMAAVLSAAVALNVTGVAFADQKADETPKADNTRQNMQMRTDKEVTADQQGQSEADRKISQEIRRALMKEKSLSTYGHNVKIITRDGKVTLKGPVRSAKEKQTIGKLAAKVAGTKKVSNKLEVAESDSK
ncbi:MAG TPA: BON domain-containing protein [Geomonas sp.]|nr:BON domain-containing protein [Geomonas sp.]